MARASAAGGVGWHRRHDTVYPEIVETCRSAWNGLEGEGPQYGYWNGKVTANSGANACLKKFRAKYNATSAQPTSASLWWERSVNPDYATRFAYVSNDGNPNGSLYASNTSCVCPCFCLVICRSMRPRRGKGEKRC